MCINDFAALYVSETIPDIREEHQRKVYVFIFSLFTSFFFFYIDIKIKIINTKSIVS